MGLLAASLVAVALPAVAQPPAPVLVPVERALARLSLGPTVGLGPSVGTRGAGALASLGLGAMVFDLYGLPDPVCEERRRREREALGGGRLERWGELIDRAQQPCRSLDEGWRPAYDAGLEVGLGLGFSPGLPRHGQLRGYFAPVSFGRFTLGLSAAAVVADAADGGSAVGLRLGPELGWHQRLDDGGHARHVLSVVLRPEASVVNTAAVPHQLLLGARFLFDL
jgi:hypothetical protein